jgi:hypothetical protein
MVSTTHLSALSWFAAEMPVLTGNVRLQVRHNACQVEHSGPRAARRYDLPSESFWESPLVHDEAEVYLPILLA